ncbi:hypothetical protein MtrunA17_Chr6g0479221 [Medicago truncatula]|uniref:Uncharacterized protein n=1 Tax=Medicago truncatula TaxID=3880 RepID=A0A396HI77_MEDTR|nr:hypothetical protein MtrunA17_Chr6g0479221 [Medicago truncatula]
MNSNTMNELGMLADALPGGSRYEITVCYNDKSLLSVNWLFNDYKIVSTSFIKPMQYSSFSTFNAVNQARSNSTKISENAYLAGILD